jgi:hypothetical protein
MNSKLLGIAVSMMLAACVSAPKGAPTTHGEARGHPLAATDTVAVFLSTEVLADRKASEVASAAPAESLASIAIRPAGDIDAIRKSFLKGFNSARPDAPVVWVDEPLRLACFESGTKSPESDRAILVKPDLSGVRCRALLEERRIRYLVSMTGWSETTSRTAAVTIWPGGGVSTKRDHLFEFVARVFDTASGLDVCGDRAWEIAQSENKGGLTVPPYVPFPLPVPIVSITTVDEPAYFARAAWVVGARVGACFVAPAIIEPGSH